MTGTASLLPSGFRDRLPPAAEAASGLVRTVVDAFAARGYERVAPPLVEHEASLARWLGKPLGGALFRSSDPATGEALAIRPDITGQIARIAVTRLAAAPRPLRLAYAGPVLRGRAGQLSPERELTQAGAELIGTDGESALAELIATALEALGRAGVTGLSVDLTTPELVPALAAGRWPVEDPDGLLAALDGKDWGALSGNGRQPYRALLDLAGPAETALPRLAALAPELAARLQALIALLPAVRVTIDPTERHGFDYYSWMGFSLFGEANGVPLRGEIGRGGAYAVRHPDGRREPAAGVSLYVDTLVDAGLGASARQRLFLPLDTSAETAHRLRAEGWATVEALSDTDSAVGCTHVWNGEQAVAKD
ncbi:ATP phosphoribosyltransferase regulatory subunit [Sandaracinobacter sp. RS1-74]|uniref:ATP phosphoribosyltransferase regulatory subunit n=1 Tax=Sandaracinobacteroides sayramensis TaxID=2913411 RepID=UPI001EDAB983|nr:ATP phosphoribosyltransferase regulatory subunit [Sandaracinobacteroides sayramensis]MCG2842537.1 ATP phosphoribosyltransferase regulatory subunit [Sandaracinobacteroides sayramensis]